MLGALSISRRIERHAGSWLARPRFRAGRPRRAGLLRYIDSPVLRDRDADGNAATGGLGAAGSGMEQRVYYLTDGNFNVTALAGTDGAILERYAYDAYGQPRVYDPNWAARQSGSYGNAILFCGYFRDAETGMYHVRHRYYHPQLGRWMSRDPLGYVDGMNLYLYVGGNPLVRIDPYGEWLSTVVGAGVGALVGGVSGYITSGGTWQGAVAGAAGGAVTGAMIGSGMGAIGAGAAGGVVASGLGQLLGGEDPLSPVGAGKMLGGAVVGGAFGAAGLGDSLIGGLLSEIASGLIGGSVDVAGDLAKGLYDTGKGLTEKHCAPLKDPNLLRDLGGGR